MRSLLFFFFFLFSLGAFAQPKGFSPVKNLREFENSLSKSNAAVHTISSDFSQVKNLALLADKIKSKGRFSMLAFQASVKQLC